MVDASHWHHIRATSFRYYTNIVTLIYEILEVADISYFWTSKVFHEMVHWETVVDLYYNLLETVKWNVVVKTARMSFDFDAIPLRRHANETFIGCWIICDWSGIRSHNSGEEAPHGAPQPLVNLTSPHNSPTSRIFVFSLNPSSLNCSCLPLIFLVIVAV
jgi:hypothetical protein